MVRARHFGDEVAVGWIGRGSMVVVIIMDDGRQRMFRFRGSSLKGDRGLVVANS